MYLPSPIRCTATPTTQSWSPGQASRLWRLRPKPQVSRVRLHRSPRADRAVAPAGGHDALDPFVAMGFAAARTTTVRLIPNVVVLPYRNPFVVAKSGATLDLLSEGRFTLAVGVGYLKREFAALGVEFDERATVFEESLEVIRGIWTTDDFSYDGTHFSANGITAHPRPVTDRPTHLDRWQHLGGAQAGDHVRRRMVPVPRTRRACQDGEHRGHGFGSPCRGCRRSAPPLRCAGRDWSRLDVTFTNTDGGIRVTTASTPMPTCRAWKACRSWGDVGAGRAAR